MTVAVAQPQPRVAALRTMAVALSLVAGLAAAVLYLQYAASSGLSHFAWMAAAFLGVATAWLAWGAQLGAIGLWPRMPRRPEAAAIVGRTVIVVPVCNEDSLVTFARVAAMHRQLRDAPARIDFAILSDSRDPLCAAAEEAAYSRLLAETAGPGGEVFYRRREANRGRKAGNIAEFVRRSGAAWDYALILDADSLMEAQTILAMIRRIEAVPDLALLQSLPRVVRARSLFGRAMQFSAAFHGPVFTRGLARLQGRTGPYWGHNAIVRLRAFAQCCGLPELPGPPPFGGHILSHDYVEAALLARGGWAVRVDPDLGGSYEEAPENLVEHARRDRRWCQGNLQHHRLLRTSGLRFWSRAIFVQGILSYLASVLWAGFLIAATLAGAMQAPVNYFPGGLAAIYDNQLGFLPVFPIDETAKATGILLGVFGLLLLPKLMVLAEALLTGRTGGHGGRRAAALSVLCDLALSALLAPVLMAFQCRSVLQVLAGRDGGWPPNLRGDGRMSLAESWAASRFITLAGLTGLVAALATVPAQVAWLTPVLLPMIIAPALIAWTSRPSRAAAIFATPEELSRPGILALHDRIVAHWQASARTGGGAPPLSAPPLAA